MDIGRNGIGAMSSASPTQFLSAEGMKSANQMESSKYNYGASGSGHGSFVSTLMGSRERSLSTGNLSEFHMGQMLPPILQQPPLMHAAGMGSHMQPNMKNFGRDAAADSAAAAAHARCWHGLTHAAEYEELRPNVSEE